MIKSIKEIAGVLFKDSSRYLPALYGSKRKRTDTNEPLWTRLRNRNEQLLINPHGAGVKCDWQWSSSLHATKIMKSWGSKLFQRAFEDWAIEFQNLNETKNIPDISVIFAHAGTERVPQLSRVIHSVGGQRDVDIECLVVDLSVESIGNLLPPGVCYEHVETSHLKPGWRKSWAYNIGARMAHGKILLFHDGDICMPASYCKTVHKTLIKDGYEVASLQRFLFYLNQKTSKHIQQTEKLPCSVPETILQNWKGGTIAILKEKFFEIGGYDEGFVDWGGEDTEFYDRCQTLNHMEFGTVPFIHLWHQPQTGRRVATNPNIETVLPWRNSLSRKDRCDELQQRNFGNKAGPDPVISYKNTELNHSMVSASWC